MKFIYIDLILLAVFSIFVALFLIKNRKKLIVESKIFLLYKTRVGIKFITWITKKLSPIMPLLTWCSISMGFILMIVMIFLLVQVTIMMIQLPIAISIPPIMPLLPYLPQAIDSNFPPFYFIHWIVAIVFLATTHEAAHGIFSTYFNIKIKSTGFGFLGPFLAAFVEPDEKTLRKRNAKQQLSILAAGSFSNFIFGIIFILLLQLFFVLSYSPAGIGNYVLMYGTVNLSDINTIGDYSVENFLDLSEQEMSSIEHPLVINTEDKKYYLTPDLIKELAKSKNLIEEKQIIIAFEDTPAYHANLSGGILKIDDREIKNINDVNDELSEHEPGEKIEIVTTEKNYEIILAEHPQEEDKGYLGIGFPQTSSILSGIGSPFFDPYVHVEPKFNPELLKFIENFFLWFIIIFFGVALFNMLPFGFLDGGRFIYVFAFALTKSEKKATKIFRFFSSLVILIFFIMMVVWVIKLNLS